MSVINSHFIKGATVLLTARNVFEKEFWSFVKAEGATSIAGVPYTYEMLKRLRFFKMDLPCLKTMIQAGGKLNAGIVKEYVEFAKENNKEFIVMYGQTEAAPRMSYLPFKWASEKYSSIGIAIPGGRFSLRDSDDRDILESDKDGELVYEGDNVCLGYAEVREDLAKGNENNGVLHTGDVARRDADGFYYITGRMKRFVKIWGNRCNLDAIEQLVKPLTTNCACIGEDDNITVFLTDPSLDGEVQKYLSQKTGLNIRAFNVKMIGEIPKKESGKIDYAALKNMM
jgi:acyl-coenzyme A synthetase/AMP-(fatty) acid ligase